MDYKAVYQEWLLHSDEDTKAELLALEETEKEERFYRELSFGTAGLRGLLGAGTNRMNCYVVGRATEGLCRYLGEFPDAKERGVVIAFDSRICSDTFALQTALVLCANGFKTWLFESLRAVPQLSFALQRLGCLAGVVITASHNPADYNGYKVYWEHGGQIGPVQAEAVQAAMRKVSYFSVSPMDERRARECGLLNILGRQEDEAYYAAIQTLLLRPEMLRQHGDSLRIVYTPLHGAGNIPVREILRRAGLGHVFVVPEQELPDGRFPTVSAPNPEDPAAFTAAEALANKVQADILLATDPDADRLGVAVRKEDGSFTVLTGNEIGCLLLQYILGTLHEQNALPANALVVKSIVSSQLANAIAGHFHVRIEEVLTGFRYISEIIVDCAKTGRNTFLFGFEESYGFLAGGFSRDKDAISTSLLVAELTVFYAQKGMSLLEAINALYRQFGYYKEYAKSHTLAGKEGMERITGAMRGLRETPPASLAGYSVMCVEDYSTRQSTHADGSRTPLSLPQTDMLRFLLEKDAWVIVRPSGTEPKLKLYAGAMDESEDRVERALQEIMADLEGRLSLLP